MRAGTDPRTQRPGPQTTYSKRAGTKQWAKKASMTTLPMMKLVFSTGEKFFIVRLVFLDAEPHDLSPVGTVPRILHCPRSPRGSVG